MLLLWLTNSITIKLKYNHFLRFLLWSNQFYNNKTEIPCKGLFQPTPLAKCLERKWLKTKQKPKINTFSSSPNTYSRCWIIYNSHITHSAALKPILSYTPNISFSIHTFAFLDIEQPSKPILQFINTYNRER